MMSKYFTDKQRARMERYKINASLPHVKRTKNTGGKDRWACAIAKHKDIEKELIGHICLDWDSPLFGHLYICEMPDGVEIINIYTPTELESSRPLTEKEIFKFRMAGRIK